MSNVVISESRRTRVWGEFPQDWFPLLDQREQIIFPLDSLSEIQSARSTITVDLPPIKWELVPSRDPFALSFKEFISLELDESEELLGKVYDLCRNLLEEAWKRGAKQAVVCDGELVLESRDIDGISNQDIERLAKERDKACYVFTAPDVIEESVWTPISGDDSYPTLEVYLGTEDSDDKGIVEESSPTYADLDTGNPSLKIFDANQFGEPLTRFSPLEMRRGEHLGRSYTYYNKRAKICVKDINGKINCTMYYVRLIRDWKGCALLQASPNRIGFIGRDVLRDLRIKLKLDPVEKTSLILEVASSMV